MELEDDINSLVNEKLPAYTTYIPKSLDYPDSNSVSNNSSGISKTISIYNKKRKRLFSFPIPHFVHKILRHRFLNNKYCHWILVQLGLFAVNFLQNEMVSFYLKFL